MARLGRAAGAPGQRRDHQLAVGAIGKHLAALRVDHLEHRQVRVEVVAGVLLRVARGALGEGHARLGEAVGAEHLHVLGTHLAQHRLDLGLHACRNHRGCLFACVVLNQ